MNFNIRVAVEFYIIRSKTKSILTVTYFDEKKNSILGSDIIKKKKRSMPYNMYIYNIYILLLYIKYKVRCVLYSPSSLVLIQYICYLFLLVISLVSILTTFLLHGYTESYIKIYAYCI